MTQKPLPAIDRGTGNAPTAYDYSVPLPYGFGCAYNKNRTFNADQIKEIRASDENAIEVAGRHNVDPSLIRKIRRRKLYKDVL